jgi:hypothetical protein
MLRNQITQFFRQLPAGRRALSLVREAAGLWTVVWGVLLVCQGLIPASQALLLRTLVNRLVTPHGWTTIAPPALAIAGLWVAGQILSSALSWVLAVARVWQHTPIHGLPRCERFTMHKCDWLQETSPHSD